MRVSNLDYLRGLAAFGIMIFHYSSWIFEDFSSETFLGRLGIYGVSVFYILSGLTLYMVYEESTSSNLASFKAFFIRRAFRIFPLLWLVTLLTIIIYKLTPTPTLVFLNLTGLFGFVNWSEYIGTGVWSIGNELVFYSLFPFFLLSIKRHIVVGYIVLAILIALYCYFAFIVLTPDSTIRKQWHDYVNPLNQVLLFFGGMFVGYFFRQKDFNLMTAVIIIMVAISIFIFYPVSGDRINLVSGIARLVFTLSCFLLCIGFFKFNMPLPEYLHKPLSTLGEMSYSVYLIHPIIYKAIKWKISGVAIMFIAVPVTLALSYFVYQRFEKYFIAKGKNVVADFVRT